MDTTTPNTSRTVRLLALMKKGDDAFNARDFAAMDAVHHPDMITHTTLNGQIASTTPEIGNGSTHWRIQD